MGSSKPTIVHRTCPLCEAHCGIAVEVDRSSGTVLGVRGDERDAFSRGYLCPKAYGLKGLHEDPDRLRRPLHRRGARGSGEFEEIGWDEALSLAAARLREIRETYGADALATYVGNPTAHDLGSLLYGPAFQRALGTRWRFSATSVDQLPKTLSSSQMFGSPGALAVPDLDRTDYFLVLGANPLVSNGSLMTAPDTAGRLRALRERGGTLVVVDPRRSETAAVADRHLFIRPGADALFLFSMVHVLFEEDRVTLGRVAAFSRGLEDLGELAQGFSPEATEAATGIAARETRRVARELAAARRAAVYGRIGTCTQRFGVLASWLVDALNALTGNLDREGGVCFPRGAATRADDTPKKTGTYPYGRWRSRVRGLPEFGGELPVASLAEEIDTPGENGERVRALVTIAGNPVLSTPNSGRLAAALATLDFVVSLDIYLNETTRFADLILPSTGHFERSNYDLVFNTLSVRNTAHWSPRIFEPAEDSREQWQILAELAGRVNGVRADQVHDLVEGGLARSTGVDPDPAIRRGPERLLDLMLRGGPYALSLEKLEAEPHGIDLGPLEAGRLPRILATEGQQLDLAPVLLVGDVPRLRAALEEPAEGGLVLVGRRNVRSNNSWMHNVQALAKGKDRCTLLVNPDDAARSGLRDGALAVVRSRVGEVTALVKVSEEMMPGVVSLPHGHGQGGEGTRQAVAARQPGVNSNLLTDEAELDTLSGTAVLNGIPVEVRPTA